MRAQSIFWAAGETEAHRQGYLPKATQITEGSIWVRVLAVVL